MARFCETVARQRGELLLRRLEGGPRPLDFCLEPGKRIRPTRPRPRNNDVTKRFRLAEGPGGQLGATPRRGHLAALRGQAEQPPQGPIFHPAAFHPRQASPGIGPEVSLPERPLMEAVGGPGGWTCEAAQPCTSPNWDCCAKLRQRRQRSGRMGFGV